MDRLASRKDPLLKVESYTYDAAGNLTTFTDRRGKSTSYIYDTLDRRTKATYADNSTTTYTYDKGDRPTQLVGSISGTITRTYDALERLASETTPQGSVSYTYDAAGRRTSATVAGQSKVAYSYDNANRLTQITQGTSSVTIGYDAASRRTALTLPDGVLAEYDYDGASHLTGIDYKLGASVLGDLTYEYDGAGNRVRIAGSFARTNLPPAVSSAAYDAANRLTNWGARSLTYDANGNAMNDGPNTYSWDVRNQLASITGTSTASLQYDAFGRRIKKTVGGATTEFLYDGINAVQELSSGTPTANLLTGLGVDEYLTRTDSTGTRNLLADGLGSTLALMDSTGGVQTEYTYEPFGKATSAGAANANSFQYTGRENDGTGLSYHRARYYNATLQRFISEDPLGFGGGDVNFYAYVGNNPIGFTDSFGLDKDKNPCAPVTPYSLNATYGLSLLGAAIGGGLGGPPGLFIGYAIGSMFGAGMNVSWVPQTNQWYAGPTANFSPGFWGGTGASLTRYSFPDQQSAGKVLSSWSGCVDFQPTPLTGATVLKSPGRSPVVGFTVGSRVPVAFGGGYNWLVWKGKCR
jgi:RHS repeat-associated protein